MHPKHLSINDFNYPLPAERIAVYPQEQRDKSKLLIYKRGEITEDIFSNIATHVPENSFFIFNNTRVLNARILFKKETGALIEIFLLEPAEPESSMEEVFQKKGSIHWKCMIGKAGKWKEKFLSKTLRIGGEVVNLKARLVDKKQDAYVTELSWTPAHFRFSEIIDTAGVTPLPPYIKRKAEESDRERYQSIFSKEEGSVAAPTASLHFTEEVFDSFSEKHIDYDFVTLHVGAGTFKPVKTDTMEGHEMHAEYIDVSIPFLQNLLQHLNNPVYCVGTTAVRTIESLYWMGVKTMANRDISLKDLRVQQWEVYDDDLPKGKQLEALESLIDYLTQRNLEHLFIQTKIIIAPGYEFQFVDGIITNFHQPKSTLLLLVAAFAGDKWKEIYDYALGHNFRFLSYGDACLLRS